MLAKIYQPARSAMQSGQARTRALGARVRSRGRALDRPSDGLDGFGRHEQPGPSAVRDSREAIAYAERRGIPFELFEPKKRRHVVRQNGYGDNFASGRRMAWTH